MLLIDAYNVLHARGILPPRLAGLEIPGLIHLISLSRYAGQPARLVCDGRRPPTDKVSALGSGQDRVTIGQAEVWYAGAGREADELIEQILRSDSAARRMLVVSSDHRIQRAARSARAQTLASESFLEHLVHDESRPRHRPLPEFATAIPLDGYSVALWVKEFGVGDWLALKSSPDQPQPSAPQPAPSLAQPLPSAAGPSPASQITGRAGRSETTPPPAASSSRGEAPRSRSAGPPTPDHPGPNPESVEPWIQEARLLWGDHFRLDDLDMSKWLRD